MAIRISSLPGSEEDLGAYGVKTVTIRSPLNDVLLRRRYDVSTRERSYSVSKLFNRMMADQDDEGREPSYSNERLYRESRELGIFNFGAKASMNADKDGPIFFSPLDNQRNSFFERVEKLNNDAWALEDERSDNLSDMEVSPISVDVDSVLNLSSSSNCLILQTLEGSIISTGTLKSTETKDYHMVASDRLFEWVRGPAASGWMIKWPMKSQASGRRTKRFFVLRGSKLSYHRGRPESIDEIENVAPAACLEITADTKAQKVRYLFYSCIQVETPNDYLYFMRAQRTDNHDRWMKQINLAINVQGRRHLFHTKGRVEILWHHESSYYELLATDANVLPDKSVQAVALFTMNRSVFSVDISAWGRDRFQLELRTGESGTDLNSILRSVKICGDVIIVGGSNGFLGVGFGAAVRGIKNLDESEGNVMFCLRPVKVGEVPEIQQLDADGNVRVNPGYLSPVSTFDFKTERNQGDCGHHATATITCIAAAPYSGFFATGDDQGGICLWKRVSHDIVAQHYDNGSAPPGAILHSFVTVAEMGGLADGRTESVRSLQFLAGEEHLVVGTNERLLLVVVPMVKEYIPEKDWLHDDAIKSPLKTKVVLTPSSGYVVSSKRKNGRQVYINVTHHDHVPLWYGSDSSIPYLAPKLEVDDNGNSISDKKLGLDTMLSPLTSVLSDLSKAGRVSSTSVTEESAEPTAITPGEGEPDSSVAANDHAANDGVSESMDAEDVPPHVPFVSITAGAEYTDDDGRPCTVYTAAVASDLFNALEPPARKELGSLIAERTNAIYADSLDVYGIQLIRKAPYMGESPRPDTVSISVQPAPLAVRHDILFLNKTIPGPASTSTVVKHRDFFGWVEVERVPKGTSAVFSLSMDESVPSGSVDGLPAREVVVWKVAREMSPSQGQQVTADRKACKIYRKVWWQSNIRKAFLRMNRINPTPLPIKEALNLPEPPPPKQEEEIKPGFFGALFGGGKKKTVSLPESPVRSPPRSPRASMTGSRRGSSLSPTRSARMSSDLARMPSWEELSASASRRRSSNMEFLKEHNKAEWRQRSLDELRESISDLRQSLEILNEETA